jgi:hypothetical protein
MQLVPLFDRQGKCFARAKISQRVEVLIWNNRVFVLRTSGEYHETSFQTLELK